MIDTVAIGRFDGLHLGHFELLKRLGDNGAILLIDTKKSNLTPPQFFDRYTPKKVFRYELESIKELSAKEFVQKLKNDFKDLKRVVVGEDFRFAKNREGSTKELRELFEGETVVVPELKIDGAGVHSRLIRALLIDGKVKEAAKYLGREYEVCGEVEKGQGIGAQKLVATINLGVKAYILPKEGVYATRTQINGRLCQSVTFVGHRVSTDGNFAVETHILEEFDKEKVDANVFVRFCAKIRDNKYYESIEELKKAIVSDIKNAKSLLQKG